jgi:hypothetical protein
MINFCFLPWLLRELESDKPELWGELLFYGIQTVSNWMTLEKMRTKEQARLLEMLRVLLSAKPRPRNRERRLGIVSQSRKLFLTKDGQGREAQ